MYERVNNTSRYRTTEQIVWHIGFKGNPNKEIVPVGFEFDLSVPWYMGWLFDRHNPKYLKAAAIHDYLLHIGYDRVSAAGAFNHGLKSTGVKYPTRFIMTLAVALFKFS